MNAKFDTLCRFFVQGKCRDGDQCKFSHDTQNVEKVDLERNEQGKLIIRGGRGKQMRPSNNNNVDSDRWERNKNNDEEPKQFRGRGDDRRKTYDRGDDRRKTYDRNQHYGDDEQQNFQKFNKSHQNKEDFQKFNNDDGDKNQSDSVPKINRGRGRGRGNEDRDQDKNDQFQRNGRFERNIKNDRNQNERDQNDNQKNDQFSKGERFDRNANRGVRNFRNNRPDRLDRIERSENFGADNQDEKPTETQPYLKKVKKNDVEVKKKAMVLKLEQKLDCDNFVQIIGYHYQFLGILKQQSIQFYSIPFKRARMDIIDEDEKVEIVHRDKRFIKGWVQEVQQNNFTLIVQFENEGENTKNLMIFENVFKQQCPIIINDIGLKELVYVVVDDDQLLTFCKDGFIRIFQQQQIDRQYKYTLHFNFDQSIESVIQVGSNYLIGARQNKLYIFNGKQAKEIPYKFDQKCTSMSLDYNRVILKLESDLESSIYILNQNLEIFGPIYKQNNFACFEIIKNYENEKLYLLCQNQSLETFIEIDNKLYPVNVLLNQSLTDIKKIEITNENMVTQKFIIGYQQNELKIFSIVPEQ